MRAGPLAMAAGLLMLCIASAVTLGNYLVWASQSMRFNSTFESGQLAVELFRFEVAVAESFVPGSRTSQAERELRYQIVRNRLSVIEQGDTYLAFSYVPQGAQEYADIKAAVLGIEPRLADLGDAAVAREVLDGLLPMNGRILQLASNAQNVLASQVTYRQHNLGRIMAVISVVVAILVVLGLALIVFILRLRRRADHDARHDALTGVLNRHGFNVALAGVRLEGPVAIVLLDVDNFKDINDRFGHDAGDAFLAQFATRLAEVMLDAKLVARLGGDEFAIAFWGPNASRDAEFFCREVARIMATPFDVGDAHFTTSASMGVAHNKGAGDDELPASLMKSADIALHAAKNAGRACHRTFDPAMRDQVLREQELRQGLFVAQAQGELHLQYQPIVELGSGGTAGFEALLRWRHPTLGEVSPGEFIPIAESSAQIISIGRWVIEQAFSCAASWPEGVFVSINLSARQFTDATLVDFVERALGRFGMPGRRVVFEITESVLVHNDAASIIASLRRLGVQVALDDFGTGFASLSYLRRFELDKIKIDKSFIDARDEDARNAVIVRLICQLAQELDLEVIAEGVETQDHLDFVKSAGCRFAQGFLFGRPQSRADGVRAAAPGA